MEGRLAQHAAMNAAALPGTWLDTAQSPHIHAGARSTGTTRWGWKSAPNGKRPRSVRVSLNDLWSHPVRQNVQGDSGKAGGAPYGREDDSLTAWELQGLCTCVYDKLGRRSHGDGCPFRKDADAWGTSRHFRGAGHWDSGKTVTSFFSQVAGEGGLRGVLGASWC